MLHFRHGSVSHVRAGHAYRRQRSMGGAPLGSPKNAHVPQEPGCAAMIAGLALCGGDPAGRGRRRAVARIPVAGRVRRGYDPNVDCGYAGLATGVYDGVVRRVRRDATWAVPHALRACASGATLAGFVVVPVQRAGPAGAGSATSITYFWRDRWPSDTAVAGRFDGPHSPGTASTEHGSRSWAVGAPSRRAWPQGVLPRMRQVGLPAPTTPWSTSGCTETAAGLPAGQARNWVLGSARRGRRDRARAGSLLVALGCGSGDSGTNYEHRYRNPQAR